jgi:hypothetical protein
MNVTIHQEPEQEEKISVDNVNKRRMGLKTVFFSVQKCIYSVKTGISKADRWVMFRTHVSLYRGGKKEGANNLFLSCATTDTLGTVTSQRL